MYMDPYTYPDPAAYTDPYIHPKDYGSMYKLEDNARASSAQMLDVGASEIINAFLNQGTSMGDYQGQQPFAGTAMTPRQIRMPRGVMYDPQGSGMAAPVPTGYTLDPSTGQPVQTGQGPAGGQWSGILGNPVAQAALLGGGFIGAKKLMGLIRGTGTRGLGGAAAEGVGAWVPKPGMAGRLGIKAPWSGADLGQVRIPGPAGQFGTTIQPTGAVAENVAAGFVNPATGRAAIGPIAGRLAMGAGLGIMGAEAINAVAPPSTGRAVASGASIGAGLGGSVGSIVPGIGTGIGAGVGAGAGAGIAYVADAKTAEEKGRRAGDVLAFATPLTAPFKLASLIPGPVGDIAGKPTDLVTDAAGAISDAIFGGGGGDSEPKKPKENAQQWLAKKMNAGNISGSEAILLDAAREQHRSEGFKGNALKRAVKADYFNLVTERIAMNTQAKEAARAQKVIDQMWAPYMDQYISQGLSRAEIFDEYANQMEANGNGGYAQAARAQAGSSREYTLRTAMAYKQQVQRVPMMQQALYQQQVGRAANIYNAQQAGVPSRIATAQFANPGSFMSPIMRMMGIKRRGV